MSYSAVDSNAIGSRARALSPPRLVSFCKGEMWADTETGTNGDCHMKTAGMLAQVREIPEAQRDLKKQIFPLAFRRSMTLLTP